MTSNPASPSRVAAGASAPVVFGASPAAATGNFTVSAQGTGGTLSHSQTLALSVQAGVSSDLPRTSYAKTDSVLTAEKSPGEPHHRHIAYDPANRQVFVANRAMNRVEVFSTTTQTRIAQISVPGATSADLSADGATVWIGTARNEIATVDPVSLSLGFGTIQPSTVSATGGATLTIRGSGFVTGAGVTFNGKAATVTFKDMNTLSVIVPVLKPVRSVSLLPIPTAGRRNYGKLDFAIFVRALSLFSFSVHPIL